MMELGIQIPVLRYFQNPYIILLDFLKDARLLVKNQSFGHAFALVVFAIEEFGKAILAFWGEIQLFTQETLFTKDIFTDHLIKQEVALGWLHNFLFLAWLHNADTRGEIVNSLHKYEVNEISKVKFRDRLISQLNEENSNISRLLLLVIRNLEKYAQNPKSLHQRRMRSLYTDLESGKVLSPLDFTRQDVDGLLSFWELFINAFYELNYLVQFRKEHFTIVNQKPEIVDIIQRIFNVLDVNYYQIKKKASSRTSQDSP